MFSFVTLSKLMIFSFLYYIVTFNHLFFYFFCLYEYVYVSFKSIDCILLLSFEIEAILLASSV